jgi:hypothetical protein
MQRGTWMQKFDSSAGKLSGDPVKLTDLDSSASGFSLPFAASQSGVVAWQEASPQLAELIWTEPGDSRRGIFANRAPIYLYPRESRWIPDATASLKDPFCPTVSR